MLAWAAVVELGLLYFCVIDDTGNPHACPYAVWPLVVAGIAAIAAAVSVAWIALSVRPLESVGAFVAALVLLSALGFALDGATN